MLMYYACVAAFDELATLAKISSKKMRRNGKKQQMHNTIFYYKIRHGSL